MDHAGVVLITLAVARTGPSGCAAAAGTSCPSRTRRSVTAASFGSQKWAHWRSGDGEVAARLARARRLAGRRTSTDDELVDRGRRRGRTAPRRRPPADGACASRAGPERSRSTGPHHPDWAAAVATALPAGLFVTGASYGGIGIPACIAQATATAGLVAGTLG